MTLVDALREVTHETRGSVGTIRLAMTTLLEQGIDDATRVELVEAADREAVRLVAELSAIPALAAAAADTSRPAPVDLTAALRAAHRAVSGLGIPVKARGRAPLVVLARPTSVDAVLQALIKFGIACGATEVSARGDGNEVIVVFTGAVTRGPLVGHLAAALNASAVAEGGDGFELRLPRVTP